MFIILHSGRLLGKMTRVAYGEQIILRSAGAGASAVRASANQPPGKVKTEAMCPSDRRQRFSSIIPRIFGAQLMQRRELHRPSLSLEPRETRLLVGEHQSRAIDQVALVEVPPAAALNLFD